jgi:hypothetical protein
MWNSVYKKARNFAEFRGIPRNSAELSTLNFRGIPRNWSHFRIKFHIPRNFKKSLPWTPYGMKGKIYLALLKKNFLFAKFSKFLWNEISQNKNNNFAKYEINISRQRNFVDHPSWQPAYLGSTPWVRRSFTTSSFLPMAARCSGVFQSISLSTREQYFTLTQLHIKFKVI